MIPPPNPLDGFPDGRDSSPSNFQTEQYTPTGITATFPPIVTLANHPFVANQAIRATKFITLPLALATGMEQLNNQLFYVQLPTTNTFALYYPNGIPVDATHYTPYISGGQFTLVGQNLLIQNPQPPPPPGIIFPGD
jgi:hypothetical protein